VETKPRRSTRSRKKTADVSAEVTAEEKPKRTRKKKTEPVPEGEKPKRPRKKKTAGTSADVSDAETTEKPKRTRRKKTAAEGSADIALETVPEQASSAGTADIPVPDIVTAEEPAVPAETGSAAEDDILHVIDEPHVPAPDETKPIGLIREDEEVLASEKIVAEGTEVPVVEEEFIPGRLPGLLKVLKNPFLYMETLSREGNYDRMMLCASVVLKWALPLIFAVTSLAVRINARPFSYVRMTFSDGAWVWFRAVCFGVIAELCGYTGQIFFLKKKFSRNEFLYQLGGDRMFAAVKTAVYTLASLCAVFSLVPGLALLAAGLTAGILLRSEITLKQADNRLQAMESVCIFMLVTVMIFVLLVHIGFPDVFRILNAV
ncbi:MAG: hypothetical protein IKF51_09020, partial [Solobacterium sp.]|nr:hypothetical protein [Solobacterium sp.]